MLGSQASLSLGDAEMAKKRPRFPEMLAGRLVCQLRRILSLANTGRDFSKRYRESSLPQRCAVCDSTAIQLHHHNYRRLGAEKLTDVTPLCDQCHGEVHRHLKEHEISVERTAEWGCRHFAETTVYRSPRRWPRSVTRSSRFALICLASPKVASGARLSWTWACASRKEPVFLAFRSFADGDNRGLALLVSWQHIPTGGRPERIEALATSAFLIGKLPEKRGLTTSIRWFRRPSETSRQRRG